MQFREDFALDRTGEKPGFIIQNHGYRTAEPCMTVGLAGQFVQKSGVICGIIAVTAGITCAEHPRSTPERIDFKPGIVGKTIVAITFLHPPRFLKGILLESRTSLGDIIVTPDVGKRKDRETPAENLSDLGELMAVVCSENYLIHLSDNACVTLNIVSVSR